MKRFEIRHLEDDTLRPLEDIVNDPEDHRKCMERFTPARWAQFKKDVSDYYRVQSHYNLYDRCGDRGFNGTPFWNTYAGVLADLLPVKRGWLIAASWLDIAFLAAGFILLGIAFGVEAALLSVIFYFGVYFNHYHYIHFSFLRYDWMGFSLAGLALIKMRRYKTSGVVLGLAAAIRLFPMVLVVGPALKFVLDFIANRKADRNLLNLGIAWLMTVFVCVSLSLAIYGSDRYIEYFDKLKVHSQIKTSTRIGLHYVMNAYKGHAVAAAVGSLFGEKAALSLRKQDSVKVQRELMRWGIIAAMLILLGMSLRKQPYDTVSALSFPLIFLFFNMTVYYYVFMAILLPMILSREKPAANAFLWAVLSIAMMIAYVPVFDGKSSQGGINELGSLLVMLSLFAVLSVYALEGTRVAECLDRSAGRAFGFCRRQLKYFVAAAVLFFIVLIVTFIGWRLSDDTPVMEDWQRALETIKKNGFNESSDLVIVTPFSSYREFSPAMTAMGDIRFSDSPADSAYWPWKKVWILSRPGLAGEEQFTKRSYHMSRTWQLGGGLFQNPVDVLALSFEEKINKKFNLLSNLNDASVKTERRNGEIECPFDEKSRRFVCSAENDWNYVGISNQEFMGRRRRAIWIHPAEKAVILKYPSVTMGDWFSLETGLSDFAATLPGGAAVQVDVYISGQRISRIRQENVPGWYEHSIDTSSFSGQTVDLELRVSSTNNGRRHFMINGEILSR